MAHHFTGYRERVGAGFCVLLTCVILLVMGGCIHTYPVPEGPGVEPGKDPTDIRVELTVRFPSTTAEYEGFPGVKTAPVRLTVAVTDPRGRTDTRAFTLQPEDISEDSFTLTLPQVFDAAKYGIAVWTDHLHPSTLKPDWYDTAVLTDIRRLWKPGSSALSEYCAAAEGGTSVDLSSYEGKWNHLEPVEVTLASPLARYRIVADDYQEFLAMTENDRRYGERYFVRAEYLTDIAGGYDLMDGLAVSPLSGVSYDTELLILTIPGVEMAVAADRLIVNPKPGKVYLRLSVYNSAQALLSRSDEVMVVPERGKMVTVRGNFLTNRIMGGLSVDNKWGEDITVDVK